MGLTLIALGVLAAVGLLVLVYVKGLDGLAALGKCWSRRSEVRQTRKAENALFRVMSSLDTHQFAAIRDDDEAPGGVGRTPDLAHPTGFQQAGPLQARPQVTSGPAERSAPTAIESGSGHIADPYPPLPGRCVASTPLVATGWGRYWPEDPYRAT